MIAALVDTGLGNLRSVEQALRAARDELGASGEIVRTRDPELIARAPRVVVPGQGGFKEGAAALASGLGDVLSERLRAGTPYLGICLGLQLLFDTSEEAPGAAGLGWFSGEVKRLRGGDGAKIPHLGWNQLELAPGPVHPCLAAVGGEGAWVYFVHSFHAVPDDGDLVRASVTHGAERVTAAVARDHVLATQFHPEKSQDAGLALLRAFLTL